MKRHDLRRLAFIALAGALLISVAAVADAPTLKADVRVTSIHASDSSHAMGPLLAFFQEQIDGQTGGASANFTLQSAHLRMETDSADPSIHGRVIGPKPMPTTTPTSYDDAMVTGLSNGVNYAFRVFSMDEANPARVEISTGCAEATPSQTASISRAPWADVSHRQTTTRDVSRALEWGCVQGAFIQIKGDFWVSLWAWNATLTTGGTTQEIHSGSEQSSNTPAGVPDISPVVSHDREIYLYATNGTLTIPSLTAKLYTLYTGSGTLLSTSNLELKGATGRLTAQGRTVDLAGSAVKVGGQAEAALAGTDVDSPLNVQLGGKADTVVVDGKPLSWAATPVAHGIPWLTDALTMGAAGLLVLLVGLGYAAPSLLYNVFTSLDIYVGSTPATTYRQRRAAAYATVARGLLQRGHARMALLICNHAMRLASTPDHRWLRCLILIARGQGEKALPDHDELNRELPKGRERALNACEAAVTCCESGQAEAALEWLAIAEKEDYLVLCRQARRPEFNLLADNEWFRIVLEGASRHFRPKREGRYDPSFA